MSTGTKPAIPATITRSTRKCTYSNWISAIRFILDSLKTKLKRSLQQNNTIRMQTAALSAAQWRTRDNAQPLRRLIRKAGDSSRSLLLSLSRNPVCTQEQTGSRTYMSEKTAKRNEDNRFLHFHVANFFKFMAANLSFTQFVT